MLFSASHSCCDTAVFLWTLILVDSRGVINHENGTQIQNELECIIERATEINRQVRMTLDDEKGSIKYRILSDARDYC